MLKFLFVVFLVLHCYAAPKAFSPTGGRIVNGTTAEEGEFPFVANLRTSDDNAHHCGASILNENFIVTAGHCVVCDAGKPKSDPGDYNLQYGLVNITTDDTNSVNIKTIYCNLFDEVYDGDYFELLYDIAVLELATPLPDDGSWAPVTLSRTFNATVQQEGVVIGWGDIDNDYHSTNTLHKLTLNVYNDTVCGTATQDHWDQHVCVGSITGYSGPCYGDSGTAALVDGVQVGLTSYLTSPFGGCGQDNETFPNVYSRIDKFFDWILSITPDVQSN